MKDAKPLQVGTIWFGRLKPGVSKVDGWLPLDGQTLSRAEYSELGSVLHIGIVETATGQFTLPNLPGHWIKAKP